MNKKDTSRFTANSLTNGQKQTLDERRATAKPNDFIPWGKAKEKLQHKKLPVLYK